jgi:hypothetical protein
MAELGQLPDRWRRRLYHAQQPDAAASSPAAGDVNSSLNASRSHAVAIWPNAKRAAPSRLSTAHWPQLFDNLQQSSAGDVIPTHRPFFRHQVDHWR